MALRTVNPEGRTSCCDAYTTFMEDGSGESTECCKACYEEVVPSCVPIRVNLRECR